MQTTTWQTDAKPDQPEGKPWQEELRLRCYGLRCSACFCEHIYYEGEHIRCKFAEPRIRYSGHKRLRHGVSPEPPDRDMEREILDWCFVEHGQVQRCMPRDLAKTAE